MKLPEGYRTRAIVPEDRPAIAALLADVDRDLLGEVDMEEEDLADEWGRPRFDFARDHLLVLGPGGTMAGYAWAWERDPGRVVVGWASPHPDHTVLYPHLLAWIESRAAEIAVPTLWVAVYENEADMTVLLQRGGYAPIRYFWRMARPIRGDEAALDPPPGIRLRGFEPDADARAAHAAIQEAFREHWGSRDEPFDEWAADHLAGEGYDPSLWTVAEDDGEVVGVLTGQRTGDRGWIGQLGVRDAWRRRGVGAALLRQAFATFARRGFTEALLSVDSENATGATRLYERVGMRSKFRFDFYEKRLNP